MLERLTIEQIKSGIKNKDFSCVELLSAYEKKFNEYKKLNVHIDTYWEEAKNSAKNVDSTKFLAGIPIAVKDMFLTKGQRTTAASKVLENFIAPYESCVTQNLKNDGYIMPFKSNLDEFAMGSSTETGCFGSTVNPWILKDGIARTPGGSSGGSASAVAAHMCLGALGTDTGGSIRQPSSFCGIVGFKPSYGRCSRRGCISFASSLDHPGVFARNVQDACYIMQSMAGYDKYDSTSLNEDVPDLIGTKANVKGKIIGVAWDAFAHLNEEYRKNIENLVENLKKEGAIIKEVKLPSFETAIQLYYIIAPAEAASNLARYDGIKYSTRVDGQNLEEILYNSRNLFGTEVKRRILIGNFVLYSDEYDEFFGKALKVRKQFAAQMEEMFEKMDVILMPTTPGVAFALGQNRCPVESYREDLYTILANIYGGPSIQIPLCKVKVDIQEEKKSEYEFLPKQDALPMGLQVMGKYKDEVGIISVAKKIEEIANWKGL